MQVFELSVLAAIAVLFNNPAIAKPTELQSHQNEIKRTIQSNLATSRLYLQGHTSNRTVPESDAGYPLPTDWHCLSLTRWRDLGENYYPRFIKQELCTSRQCYNDFYTCFPQYYPLTVLRKRRDNEESREETALPLQLREMWVFEVIEVPVACMCGTG
ncbi:prothoracicotropic hormone-like [Mercenaria mercenaria]|uniref:prothoracicotropic hormone-like n=1 Tax=Mercenaria mercenaria TaxID=6596 RepID=UPI00234F228D|nr:prothoracicotropic hormone-like [Mercenaria mercenaria]